MHKVSKYDIVLFIIVIVYTIVLVSCLLSWPAKRQRRSFPFVFRKPKSFLVGKIFFRITYISRRFMFGFVWCSLEFQVPRTRSSPWLGNPIIQESFSEWILRHKQFISFKITCMRLWNDFQGVGSLSLSIWQSWIEAIITWWSFNRFFHYIFKSWGISLPSYPYRYIFNHNFYSLVGMLQVVWR